MKKNILAIQLNSTIGDKTANFNKVKYLIEKFFSTSPKTPDILILPEVWTCGWYCPIFNKMGDAEGETEKFLSELAKKYNVNIIGGSYLREYDGKITNCVPVILKNGNLLARYEKIHLYAPDGEAQYVSAGNNPVIVNIEGINIGLSVCYDIRFPELFRSYINSSCPPELLINMSAWPKTRRDAYFYMSHSRAVENQCYFLALSQTGLIKDDVYNSGFSHFCAPLGETLDSIDEKEGFIFETIDTDIVNSVRKTYPNLDNRKIHDFGFKAEIFNEELYV